MKIIRWGILGTGWMAARFLQDFNKVNGCEVMAVGSRSREKAESFIREQGLSKARAYGSYEELAADPDVHVIYVTTPHPYHLENSLSALEGGKAVLCEKPFTVNRQQGVRLFRRARQKKLFIMEAMWTAFLPVIQQVKQLVSEGAIGKVIRFHADLSMKLPRESKRLYTPALAGGALLDLGIYPISLCCLLFGYKPKALKALSLFTETGVDGLSSVILTYTNGPIAMLSCSMQSDSDCAVRIEGTTGRITIPKFWMAESAIIERDGLPTETITGEMGYHFEAEEVNRCIRERITESPFMPSQFSLGVLDIMDRIREKIGLKYPFE